MHGLVLRIIKKKKQHTTYIGRMILQIDELLLKHVHLQNLVDPPRSLKKHVKYWKVSELRSWLLFYSLPLLLDFLPPLYLHHFSLLACSLHILLEDNITTNVVNTADLMLQDFVKLLPQLYMVKGAVQLMLTSLATSQNMFNFGVPCGHTQHLGLRTLMGI